jgi:hypothetical protein
LVSKEKITLLKSPDLRLNSVSMKCMSYFYHKNRNV